jgi:hypothetical protein
MLPPSTTIEKLVLALVLILSLAALAFTWLAPGFSFDYGSVYGGF